MIICVLFVVECHLMVMRMEEQQYQIHFQANKSEEEGLLVHCLAFSFSPSC